MTSLFKNARLYTGVGLLLLLCAMSTAAARDNNVIIGGTVFSKPSITTNAIGITIKHATGIAFIDFMEMPSEEERFRYGYDPDSYSLQKKDDALRALQIAENKKIQARNATLRRTAAENAIRVEVQIKDRRDSYVFAEGDRITSKTEKINYTKTVQRLKGPGMRNRDETIPAHKMVTTTARETIKGGLLIADLNARIQVTSRWSGVLYPAGISKKGIPVYTTSLDDMVHLQSTSGSNIEKALNGPIMDLLTGFWHGLSLPARLAKIRGLTLKDANDRTGFYISGLAAGFISVLALFGSLINLITRRRKQRKTKVKRPPLPWET